MRKRLRRVLGVARWVLVAYLLLVLAVWTLPVADWAIILPAAGPMEAPGTTALTIPFDGGAVGGVFGGGACGERAGILRAVLRRQRGPRESLDGGGGADVA